MKASHLLLSISFLLISSVTMAQSVQLYGMAYRGGAHQDRGTIVKMNPNGSGFTKVYDFDSTGSNPLGNLIQAKNGKLYGVGESGGYDDSCVIFSYDPTTNTFVDVHDFDSTSDGPTGGMIEGPDGIFYGLASYGKLGNGDIYSYDPVNNKYTDLYDFDGINGSNPLGSPFLASDGKLYGMTGDRGATYGGVIYSFDISTKEYADLYDLQFMGVGSNPGNFIQLSDGKLYGLTFSDDMTGGVGTIFSFDPMSKLLTTLHNFNTTEGAYPNGSLMIADNGLLYGMTSTGGTNDIGVIYSFDPNNGTYKDLFDFDQTNGAIPLGSLMQSSDGKLYGTASRGGKDDLGVAFSFDITNKTVSVLGQFDSINGSDPQGGFSFYKGDVATGIKPVTKPAALSIYPQPANQIITCTIPSSLSGNATLTITDINGRNLFTKPLDVSRANPEYSLDMSSLGTGVYFLELVSGDKKFMGKVVKE